MPLVTADSLIDALRGRPILRPDQFEQLTREQNSTQTEPRELALALIKRGWITVYQAKKLLSGRPDDLVIGPYVILDKLGEGGMGKVYKAMQLSLDRMVALKVVRNSLLKNEVALKRFQREVRAAAKLKHPNIVTVFDADQVGDRHFLVMEFIAGIDLARMVKERSALPIGMACSVVRQAALGLQSAHDLGFIHRDIKPSNLLIASDPKGQFAVRSVVKILDMGLARVQSDDLAGENISTELTRTGTVIGTPDYMSPEQAKNSSAVDHRSDLYSLGCTFYHLLTGEAPFPTGTPLEKLLQHQMDSPRPVQLIRMDVPPEVATILHTLLAKRPDNRFQSAMALAHALEPWCSDAGNSAIPPALVPTAEAVDPTSVTLETAPQDPFDFGHQVEAATPESTRRAAPTRSTKRKSRNFPWLIVVASILAASMLVALVAIGIAIAARKKAEASPGNSEPVKNEVPPKPPPRTAKADPPPVRDLEVIDKYLPDDSTIAVVFDLKAWQVYEPARQFALAPMAERLAKFHRATGVDLLAVVERVIVALGANEKSGEVIVLQGRGLVTPNLIDAVKSMPGVESEAAWQDGPDLLVLGSQSGAGRAFVGTSETCAIISSHRQRVVDALRKHEGMKTTQFADPTFGRGLEFAHTRPFAAFAAMGMRSGWARTQPAASKINFAAAGVTFDDRGMHLHTVADETEAGKVAELQKSFGRTLDAKANASNPPDLRVQRIAHLLLDAQPGKLSLPAFRRTHLSSLVPTRKLEEWFAPFFSQTDK